MPDGHRWVGQKAGETGTADSGGKEGEQDRQPQCAVPRVGWRARCDCCAAQGLADSHPVDGANLPVIQSTVNLSMVIQARAFTTCPERPRYTRGVSRRLLGCLPAHPVLAAASHRGVTTMAMLAKGPYKQHSFQLVGLKGLSEKQIDVHLKLMPVM